MHHKLHAHWHIWSNGSQRALGLILLSIHYDALSFQNQSLVSLGAASTSTSPAPPLVFQRKTSARCSIHRVSNDLFSVIWVTPLSHGAPGSYGIAAHSSSPCPPHCSQGHSVCALPVLWCEGPEILYAVSTVGLCHAIIVAPAGQVAFSSHSALLWGVFAVGLTFFTNLWAVVLIAWRFLYVSISP